MVSCLLLTISVALGQTGTDTAPASAAAVLPTSPPPDRWLLMKSLQGTWEGWLLDSERMQLTGWVDVSYTASSAAHNNLPLGFNYRANEFLLQQNWVRFERTVVTNGTTDPTFGFRCDAIVPGADYRFTTARGLFSGQLTSRNGEPAPYGIDPIQFYAEGYFPTLACGLDVKVGRIFCQYGVEANDAVSNALESHSYTFIYDPFTHTGVMGTLKLTDAWSIQAGMMLGSDIFIDPADEPTGMGSIKWAPPGGRDSVLFSVIIGPGRFNQGKSFHNPDVFDLVYTHTFDQRLTYNLESLFGFTTNVPHIGTATWCGIVNYVTYTVSPRVAATARLEFFNDSQGQRTGFEGLYTAFTAGLTFRPIKAVLLRPELRYDYNGQSRPFEDKHGLFTATADLILRW
jgi:hypothetical protein